MSYSVYILECGDGSLYTGIATDVGKRLGQHRAGLGAKYTRGRSPLALVYVAEVGNRSEASREEARIKKLKKGEKVALIESGDVALLHKILGEEKKCLEKG